MKKMPVNYYYLEQLINTLGHLNEVEEDALLQIDPNDKNSMTDFIKKHLVPDYQFQKPGLQKVMKETLRYLLNQEDAPYVKLIDGTISPLNAPEHPKDFFIWLWEALFEDESYEIKDPELYIYQKDHTAFNPFWKEN